MADHGEASHSVNPFIVIQNIRETPVHLVGLAGGSCIAAPAVALRRDLLTLGGDEMFVRGNVPFHCAAASRKANCLQTCQANSRITDSASQQVVQNRTVSV